MSVICINGHSRFGAPPCQPKGKKNHQCTSRVIVRASSHVLYLLSVVANTEPNQVYGGKQGFGTLKDIIIITDPLSRGFGIPNERFYQEFSRTGGLGRRPRTDSASPFSRYRWTVVARRPGPCRLPYNSKNKETRPIIAPPPHHG